jgi:hypothetical protein
MSAEESKSTEESKHQGIDTLIFTIGRMNPPTTGHMGLIKQMIEKAIELEKNEKKTTQVAVILSHSHEKEILKNPLQCREYKRDLVREMIKELKTQMIKENKDNSEYIENITPVVICMNDEKVPNMYSSIGSLVRKYKPNKMILFIGEDRDESFSGIKKYYENIELQTLKRPEEAMSATEMRGYVSSGNKDEFVKKMLPSGLSEERIDNLYNELHKVLTDPKNQPKVKATPQPKTTTRKRKSTEQEGGRKNRKSKRRFVNTKKNKNKKKKSLRRRR